MVSTSQPQAISLDTIKSVRKIGRSEMLHTDLQTAIDEGVSDGDAVHLAGFVHAAPFAASHEIIRQEITDMTLSRVSPDLIYDQLLSAGCATKFLFSFASQRMRSAIESGMPDGSAFNYEEYTHFGLTARLAAGARDLPFQPVRTFTGTDLPEHNDNIRTVRSPFDDTTEIHVVPPYTPDVTIAHVPRADKTGNAQLWGIIGDVRDAVFAADTVILTTEEIISERDVRSDPNRTVIPGFKVDYLCTVPYGAHPSYVQGYYQRDQSVYTEWDDIASSHESVIDWLDEWVYGVDDHEGYLEKIGVDRLLGLTPESQYAIPTNYGAYQ